MKKEQAVLLIEDVVLGSALRERIARLPSVTLQKSNQIDSKNEVDEMEL